VPGATPASGTDDGDAALYSLERLARDLDELITALELDRQPLVLVGQSMGGFVAFTYYGLFPHKVRSIVAISSTLGYTAETRCRMREQVEAWKLQDLVTWNATRSSLTRIAASWNFTHAWVRLRPGELTTFTRAIDEASRLAWIYCVQGFSSNAYDYWCRAPMVCVPVLVVHGGQDPLIPEADAIRMQQVLPDCQMVRIALGRHGVLLECSAAVLNAVGTFLAALTGHPP